jgi:hypothetical protein
VADYRLHVNSIGRSAGRSAVGAIAYRAGIELTERRTGEVHDYRRKSDVLHSELILPGGGSADRSEFWNAVETHHRRGDAVLIREIQLSLPTELTREQRRELSAAYAREVADRYGVAVDIALHAPRTVTDRDLELKPNQHWVIDPVDGRRHNGNWHAHISLSACHVAPDGTLGRKAVELDPIHCQRAKIPNLAERERPRWAELENAALAAAGHAVRVDHRSLEAQRIEAEQAGEVERAAELDREPTRHLGPGASAMERDGVATWIGDENRAIVIDAAERFRLASEQAALEREIAQVEAQLIDLAAEREKRAAAKRERERIAGMSSTELAAEITRLTPPRPSDVLAYSGPHLRAQADYQRAMAEETRAKNATNDGKVKLRKWRERHGMRGWLHEQGLLRDERVSELEQWLARRPEVERQRAEAVAAAQAEARRVEDQELARIEAEQGPVRERVAMLEGLRQQKAQEEQIAARIERDIAEKVVMFESAARHRRTGANGWGDDGQRWQSIPRTWRVHIEAYNAADDDRRARTLASFERQIREQPEKGEALQQALAPSLGRGHDMGMGY